MRYRAPLVPVTERFPFCSIASRTMNVALAGENEVGMKREAEVLQSRLQQINGAAGIDGPDGAAILERLEKFHAVGIEDRFAHARDDCAVKVGADEFDAHFRKQIAVW